jgi:hypothetical protein
LDHVFEKNFENVISEDKFIDTFSKKLGSFVQERNYPENIQSLINDDSFVAEVKEWFKDFISPRYYKNISPKVQLWMQHTRRQTVQPNAKENLLLRKPIMFLVEVGRRQMRLFDTKLS